MKKAAKRKTRVVKSPARPRRQFVKPRRAVTTQAASGKTPALPIFIYIEARRFDDDGLITFDHIVVMGARDEAEAYTFGAAQLDTRQQANDPDNNAHLLATPANDYVVTL